MKKQIGITAWGAVSALGAKRTAVVSAYLNENTFLERDPIDGTWKGSLPETPLPLGKLGERKRFLEQIDRSVLLAFLAADQFWEALPWDKQAPVGINLGSSRGATGLWEEYYQKFTGDRAYGISPLSSPMTTLGNLSSWLGAYLGVTGPAISHSVTCSSALQAVMNGLVWLESGRCRYFIAGGSEAPLTDFTLAQMKALRIYADPVPADYPCRSLDDQKTVNSMVLGEGAALFAMESNPTQALARIAGIGYAQEMPTSPTSVSADGQALQLSMRQALKEYRRDTVDVVVCHAPGTRKGDAAEIKAVHAVFGRKLPVLTGNKWKLGHTLGASGGLSLEMALLMLQQNRIFPVPFLDEPAKLDKQVESVMINAMGFGGNAVSVILTRYSH